MKDLDTVIEKAGIGNLEELITLTNETFSESWMESDNSNDIEVYVKEYFGREQLEKELKNDGILYLQMRSGSTSVGYIKLERQASPEGYVLENSLALHRIYVRKEYQGRRLGTKLLEAAIAIGHTEGFKTIWLGVWNANKGAIRLYEKFGFQIFGNYQFKMGSTISDDYLMKLEL